jgi:hypothetical protein
MLARRKGAFYHVIMQVVRRANMHRVNFAVRQHLCIVGIILRNKHGAAFFFRTGLVNVHNAQNLGKTQPP